MLRLLGSSRHPVKAPFPPGADGKLTSGSGYCTNMFHDLHSVGLQIQRVPAGGRAKSVEL